MKGKEMKKLVYLLGLFVSLGLITACASQADIASQNVSTAADQFQVERRIVFYNGITDSYMLSMEGLCSLGNFDKPHELSVTCKVGPNAYKKSFLGLSDNVTYFVEQIDPSDVDVYHYTVLFRPAQIIPHIQVDVKP